MADLRIYRGDTHTYNLTFVSGGAAYDLTDCTIYFTVKDSENDPDADALISKDVTVHTNPTGGLSAIVLSSTDTNIAPGSYYYDIQLKTASDLIFTVTKGLFIVSADITRRVT